MSETIEEIFGYAPKDATHYNQNNQMHYKFIGDAGLFWNDSRSEWLLSSSRHNYPVMIERPTVKPWSGPEDGLPPVGEIVEVYDEDEDQWVVGKVVYLGVNAGSTICVIQGELDLMYGYSSDEIRKPRTPEQLASEKRETAIREFMDVVGIDCRVTASKAVDAGFKREVV